MTHNQIAYWANVETKRSNRANEKERHRSNLANERETHRANVTREEETERHNRATEGISQQEADTHAGQLSLAQLQNRQAQYWQTLDYNLKNRQQSEVERSNRATERINTQKIDYDYIINQARNAIQSQIAGETKRSNLAKEAQTKFSLEETQRHNKALETTQQAENAERARSNLANETIRRSANEISAQQADIQRKTQQEAARHNAIVEQEQHRANVTRETIDTWNATANMMRGAGSLMNSISSSGLSSAVGGKISNLKEAIYLWQLRK